MTSTCRHSGGRVIVHPGLMQLLHGLPQRAGMGCLDGQSL